MIYLIQIDIVKWPMNGKVQSCLRVCLEVILGVPVSCYSLVGIFFWKRHYYYPESGREEMSPVDRSQDSSWEEMSPVDRSQDSSWKASMSGPACTLICILKPQGGAGKHARCYRAHMAVSRLLRNDPLSQLFLQVTLFQVAVKSWLADK